MELNILQREFDRMQMFHGNKNLNAIYGCGKEQNPKLALVFLCPNINNIATRKTWKGVRAHHLGTKPLWNILSQCDMFDKNLNEQIKCRKPSEWDNLFCQDVYNSVKENDMWITSISKCSNANSKLPDNKTLRLYRDLLLEELFKVNPDKVVVFGSEAATILLRKDIKVSQSRKQEFGLVAKNRRFKTYVTQCVGAGKVCDSIEDLNYIKNIDLT